MIKIWHNTRCGKSRDSKNLLDEKKCDYEIFEYLKEDLSGDDIKDVASKLGISDVRDMMRKKEAEYKMLDLANEVKSQDELIGSMVLFPKLIERPIVIKDDKAAIGRPIENILKLLG